MGQRWSARLFETPPPKGHWQWRVRYVLPECAETFGPLGGAGGGGGAKRTMIKELHLKIRAPMSNSARQWTEQPAEWIRGLRTLSKAQCGGGKPGG